MIIGNYEAYVKWNLVNRHSTRVFTTRTLLKPNKTPVVESFMLKGTPEKYTNGIITTGEYKKLSELIKYLKDKENKKINEQTFELILNA